MQPEQVDVSKAGRKAGSAFKDDSFHNYMARKIELQRQQFGVVDLPPPLPQCPPSPPSKASSPPKAKSILKSPLSLQTNNHKVRFSEPDLPRIRLNESHSDTSDVGSIIQKLERRHGKLKHKRRRKSTNRKHRKRNRTLLTLIEEDSMHQEIGNCSVPTPEERLPTHEAKSKPCHEGDDVPTSTRSLIPMNQESAECLGHVEDAESGLFPLDDCPQEESEDGRKTPHSLITPTSPASIRMARPDLFFYGVVIKVNGYTDPDNETLKRMVCSQLEADLSSSPDHFVFYSLLLLPASKIQRYGGQFECYETQRVTHIVAENLSTAKANIFKKQRNPIPVVSPRWIVDSITQQSLLPYGKYLIDEVRELGQQQGIKELFGAAKKPSCFKTGTAAKPSNPTDSVQKISKSPKQELGGEVESKSSCNKETDKTDIEGAQLVSRPIVSNDQRREDSLLGTEGDYDDPTRNNLPLQPGIKTNDKLINGRIRTVGTDPNFLNSYFNSSRLSFIGSYKQRAANLPSSCRAPRKAAGHLDRYVFHVDMDCFFASVALRRFPEYKDRPVVISHHGKKKGETHSIESNYEISNKSTSECATCNYKAREFGIKKGMFLGRAKELCKDLVILNYDFEGYQEVSEQVSEILHRVAGQNFGSVENVSCDESYIELMLENQEQAATVAENIRMEILKTTNCTASVGVAANKFLAKLGTDKCKPNGSFVVEDHRSLLVNLKLRDLPGVGWRSEPKLVSAGLRTVSDIWDLGPNGTSVLRQILGPANGEKISKYCQGKDDRPVEPARRKTIGAECNYGVRFDGPYGIDHFMQCLADEVQKRMENVGVRGRHVTLKVKQRKKGAKNPPKFLGHGSCHNLSRSTEVPGSAATCNAKLISRVGMNLFNELGIPVDDVRGMGIVISKLSEGTQSSHTELTNWLSSSKKKARPAARRVVPESYDAQMDESAIEQDDPLTEDQSKSALAINKHQVDSVIDIEDDEVEVKNPSTEFDVKHIQCCSTEDDSRASLTRNEAFTQIALPPLSQIRMSQVEELPIDLQRQIRSRIEEHVNDVARQSTNEEVIQIDDQEPQHMRDGSFPTSHFCQRDDPRTHRFRQTDVKQMFKLAEVEAGTMLSGVSLDVLNQLPMELKLQIMNGDYGEFSDFAKANKLSMMKDSNLKHSIGHRMRGETTSLPQGNSGTNRNMTIAEDRESAASTSNAPPENVRDHSAARNVVKQPPANLYEEDVLPLKLFLDENSSTDPEAVRLVTTFLTICIQEGRSKDMVTLVRTIRKRGDGWSDESVLSQILQSLDNEYLQLHGARLDRNWAMGTKRI
eukprot:scaffold7139_cov115-Cylindrotheca_fusiformis.AAC.19